MCKRCDWSEWFETIDDMIVSEDYEFADDTLEGIREWVEENEHITPKQIAAVENIRVSTIGDGTDPWEPS